MSKHSILIYWSKEDDAFIALSPEFPGLSTFGETREEALKEAELVMHEMISLAKEHNECVPSPVLFDSIVKH